MTIAAVASARRSGPGRRPSAGPSTATKREPQVSYVMATRNHGIALPRTFANLRQFIREEDELVVVDGASTDQTSAVLAQQRDLISVLVSEPDQGEAHAVNKGLVRARGEIIKWLTDDDYIYPDAMRAAVDCMLQHPELDALMGGGRLLRPDGTCRTTFSCPDGVAYFAAPFSVQARAGVCGEGLLFRRRILPWVGLLDPSYYAVDAELIARMARRKVNGRFLRVHLYDQATWEASAKLRQPRRMVSDIRRILQRDGEYLEALPWWCKEVGMLWSQRSRLVRDGALPLAERRWAALKPAFGWTDEPAPAWFRGWDGRLL